MPVNLSIKNAPDDVVERLRKRAERNHRSLQGELPAIIEAAAEQETRSSPAAILAKISAMGLSTPDEGADMIRAAGDGR